jgi:uncharacterized protein
MGPGAGREEGRGTGPVREVLAVKRALLALATACLLGQAVPLHADFKVPALSGPVVDNASMLSGAGAAQIAQAIRRLHDAGGSQYAVLTVPDLGGEAIEAASIQVTDLWKLGAKGKDNGVLVMLARDDHKIRIEVGQGLEGDLTDAYTSRVIRNTMVPLMRQGDTDQAVEQALANLMQKSDPALVGQAGLPPPDDSADGNTGFSYIFFIVFILIWMVLRILSGFSGHGRRFGGGGGFYGGGFGGGGFGGGGFGGGGFSGGGGGFSGGGSSGSW